MSVIDLHLSLEFSGNSSLACLRKVDGDTALAEGSGIKPDLRSIPFTRVGGHSLAKCGLPATVEAALCSYLNRRPVRLWIEVPQEFAEFPWEMMWLRDYGNFLACHPLVSIVRGKPCRLFRISPGEIPRILIASANPGTARYGPLESVDRELKSIRNALDNRECGRFEIQELRHARRETLLSDLTSFRPDILHYIGHGTPGGAMVLECEPGQHSLLYADELVSVLEKSCTRLLFLSSCFSAKATTTLAQIDCISVVGMQAAIRDSTGHLFSRATYAALSDGSALDEAVQHGRAAISGCGVEAALPVLVAGSALQVPDMPQANAARLNYPPDSRPFVGRKEQRQFLWKKLRADGVRLVTVFGIGGMGKTRLAKQVGEDLQHDFRHGVRLVECGVLQSREELIEALAKAGDVAALSDTHEFAAQFADREQLLLIDCFETLVAHAEVLDEILQRSACVKILLTSRIVLESDFQYAFELKELESKGKKALAKSERAELFLGAAHQADSTFQLTPANKKLVEEIVDMLQGVPLALLLAAGRLRYKALEELHHDLTVRLLDALKKTSAKRDRHASIQIVIQDSFDLLAVEDRQVAIQLSVFSGGFTVKDAVAVLGSGVEVGDGIARLYDQSLLASAETGVQRRFRELDTVREYMSRAAESVDLSALRTRHAWHYAERALGLKKRLAAGWSPEIGESVWLDIGNFRAAVKHARSEGSNEILLDLARSLSRTFLEAGILSDFAALVEAADVSAIQLNDLELLIELRGLQGTHARRQGDLAAAEQFWRERASFAKQTGDISLEVDSYLDIAEMALRDGKLDVAEEMIANFHNVKDHINLSSVKACGLAIDSRLRLERGDKDGALRLAVLTEKELNSKPIYDGPPHFALLSLAKVHRACGTHDRAAYFCRLVIEDSISNNMGHTAGVALLDLSETLEEAGDMAGTQLVTAVADRAFGKMPTLRTRILRRISELPLSKGQLAEGELKVRNQEWQVVVRTWLEGLNLTAM